MKLKRRGIRVPYKQQMTDSDCGPACLAMILGAYGYRTTVYQTRITCEDIGQPQSLRTILAAARRFGLEGNMLAADLNSIELINFPAIIHWNFQHYVVLESITAGGYVIVDPAMGRRKVERQEFSESFTGIVASLKPGRGFKKQREQSNQAFRAYIKEALLNGSVLRIAGSVLFLAFVMQGISLLVPGLTAYLIDVVLPGDARAIHRALLPLIGCGIVAVGSVAYLRSTAIAFLQSRIDETLLSGFVQHLLRLPSRFFLDKSVADIHSRMNSSTVIRDATSSYVVGAMLDVCMGIGYQVVLYMISPRFACLAIGLIVVQLLIYTFHFSRMRDKIAAEVKTQSIYQQYVYELLSGMLTVKAASAESEVERSWKSKLRNYLLTAKHRAISDAPLDAAIYAMRIGTPVALLWYSAGQYFDNALSLGTVLAMNAIAAMAVTPILSLAGIAKQLQHVRSHLERMSDVWMHEQERYGSTPSPSLSTSGYIDFEDVAFAFKGSDRQAIKGLTMRIPLGKKVGIVGPSGSGKSTLVSLLMGFHAPDAGRILVNGTPLGDIDIPSYRARIGFVSQQTFLFSSSIRRNIALGNPGAELDDIESAISSAGLVETVASMPLGIDALVGNDGGNLSGGQRQRIAIARALLRSPELLVLDEATSSLDSDTERYVANAVASRPCTQIIISHRLSTVEKCDIIFVIEDGVVCASGSHEELLESNTFYRSCYMGGSFDAEYATSDLKLRGVV